MTISSTTRKAGPFLGDDSTTVFPFAFKVFYESDLVVIHTDPLSSEDTLTLGVDYTVSLNADQNTEPGGNVTIGTALESDYKLTITSNLEYLQPVDITNGGGFYPAVINAAFDRLTIFCQQLAEESSRSIQSQISSDLSPTDLLDSIYSTSSAAAESAAEAAASAVEASTYPLPPGLIGMFGRSTAPPGWLKANGAIISRSTYASLFDAIGENFGAGDGATTFALPDMRGEFPRGWDDGRGIDASRVFGSSQTDLFKSHTHTVTSSTTVSLASGGVGYGVASGDVQSEATGGTETRPRNVALLACIKY